MSSSIIEQAYRDYSMYILEDRALLYIQDGLRSSIRRSIWTARNKLKVKTLSLSGAVAKLHPHGDVSEVIQNFTSVFKNNVPYFDGNDAGFGTLLSPSHYSAPRYTSIKISDFTTDVILADIDLITFQPNYDSTCEELKFLLPLVPIHFLNPIIGMANGFKCDILPYDLKDLIDAQICILQDKPFPHIVPYFKPLKQKGTYIRTTEKGNNIWQFNGTVEQISQYKWRVTSLPFGIEHSKFIENISKLVDDNVVVNIEDLSSDKLNCIVTFSRNNIIDEQFVMETLKLSSRKTECLYFIDGDHNMVKQYSVEEAIRQFTNYRLSFFFTRIKTQNDVISNDIVFLQMFVATVQLIKRVGLPTHISKQQFAELLVQNDITSFVDKIINLPIYKFNDEEVEHALLEINKKQQIVIKNLDIIRDESKLKKVYIKSLNDIKKRYC